jgi:hypothetical protein
MKFICSELDTLRTIFINCQCLEIITIVCIFLREITKKEILETDVNYSSNNFYELRMLNRSESGFISPEDLESSFIILKNIVPLKPFVLTAIKNISEVSSLLSEENMKIIKI